MKMRLNDPNSSNSSFRSSIFSFPYISYFFVFLCLFVAIWRIQPVSSAEKDISLVSAPLNRFRNIRSISSSSDNDEIVRKLDAIAERLNQENGHNSQASASGSGSNLRTKAQNQNLGSVESSRLVPEDASTRLENLKLLLRREDEGEDTNTVGEDETTSEEQQRQQRSVRVRRDSDQTSPAKGGTVAAKAQEPNSLSCYWQAPIAETRRYYSVLLPHNQAVTQRDQHPGVLDFVIKDGHCHVTDVPPEYHLYCVKTTHELLNKTKGDQYFDVEKKCYFKYDKLKVGCTERKYNVTVNGQVILNGIETECICDSSDCNTASIISQEATIIKWCMPILALLLSVINVPR